MLNLSPRWPIPMLWELIITSTASKLPSVILPNPSTLPFFPRVWHLSFQNLFKASKFMVSSQQSYISLQQSLRILCWASSSATCEMFGTLRIGKKKPWFQHQEKEDEMKKEHWRFWSFHTSILYFLDPRYLMVLNFQN